jgi:oligoendopeptidase F
MKDSDWNLGDLFDTPEDFECSLSAFLEEARAIRAFRRRLHEGQPIVLACLKAHLHVMERIGPPYAYAFNRVSAEGLSTESRDAHSRVVSMIHPRQHL